MMKPLLVALLVLTLASCRGTDRTVASVSEDNFARVYAQLVMASSDPQSASRTSPELILKNAGMTQEEFRKTVAEYNRDPQRWGALMDKVQQIVEEEVARLTSTQPGPGAPAGGPGTRSPAAGDQASKPGSAPSTSDDTSSSRQDTPSRPQEPSSRRGNAPPGLPLR